MTVASEPCRPEEKADDKKSLILASGVASSAIIVAPYIGKSLNFFPDFMKSAIMQCNGTGLAGHINNLIGALPIVGKTLAENEIAAATTSGVIGIGGALLGNYIQKNYDGKTDIPWGKVIKYACLTTSVLIALPSILTGLSIGLGYLATAVFGEAAGNAALTAAVSTLGATAMNATAAGAGIGSLMTHLLTCGGAALSLAGAFWLNKNQEQNTHEEIINRAPVSMEITSCAKLEKDKSCEISFRLLDADGKTLSDADLKTTHTKKLHVMLVDNSLTDYHHIHPEYDASSGLFKAEFTPKMQGGYSAWHDFTMNNGTHFVLKNELAATRDYNIPPSIKHTEFVTANGLSASISCTPALGYGKSSVMSIKITDASGKPVDFEPVMGAFGHLVGFSKDKQDYIHCHPIDEQPKNGELQFHVAPSAAGFSKFFLGVKINGREATIPFGQYIQPRNQAIEQINSLDENQPKNWQGILHSNHSAQIQTSPSI